MEMRYNEMHNNIETVVFIFYKAKENSKGTESACVQMDPLQVKSNLTMLRHNYVE